MADQQITTLIFDFANVLLFARRMSPPSSLSLMYSKLSGSSSIWDSYQLNDEVFDFLSERKAKYQLAILTSSHNLPKHPEIKPKLEAVFEQIFLSGEMEYPKSAAECYEVVLNELGAKAAQTVFVDDSIDNIEAAEAAGLRIVHYSNNTKLFERLLDFGIK